MVSRWWALVLGASLATCGGISRAADVASAVGPASLTALSGDKIVMDNYGERPATVVVFLSSRSDATEEAIAALNRMHDKHRRLRALFVGVCSNPAESGEDLRTYAQRRGVIFPVYRDPDGSVARQFGARLTPEVFVVDRQGKLAFHGGAHNDESRAALEAAIVGVLRKQPLEKSATSVEGTPMDRPGEKREISDLYPTLAFSSELVFEKIPGAAVHHCSTICEAGNRDLLCLWYGGSYESADDQAIYLARKKPDDKNWSTPRVLLQNATQPPGNGVIFRDAQDRTWIVWCRMEGSRPMPRGSGWGRCRLMFRTSADHGETWTEDRPLIAETLWCVPRNPPVPLADGTLLLPVEGLKDGVDGSHFFALARGADVWRQLGFTSGGSQPAVIQRNDSSLLALLRHSRFIRQIESRDGGQSWTKAEPTTLKNPDAGITATRLANGHVLLVYNDSQVDRTPLSVVRSLDEGKTWEKPMHLESNPGEYSYPCIIQSADGKVHITYTCRRYAIKHVEMNEEWLVSVERPD